MAKEAMAQLTLRVTEEIREILRETGEANGMGISQLVRFLALKVRDNPELMGLRDPSEDKKKPRLP